MPLLAKGPIRLGSTTTRTNLCADPSGAGGASSPAWSKSPGTTWQASGGNLNPACWQLVGSAVNSSSVYLSTASGQPMAVTPGQVVTISCSAKRGVGASNLRLFAESTYGSVIVAGSDTTVTLTGAYARYATTFTVPSGITQVWLFACIACVTVNDSILVGDFLVEGAAAAGGYFDGDTLNATWNGTQYDSSSTQLVLSQNPALPVLEFAAWPGVSPAINQVPSSGRTILTDRTKAFKISRGRQYELAQDEAASGSVTLDNSDGQVTGGTNGCMPITSCRLTAQWQGQAYAVWTGQVRSWPGQDDSPATSTSQAELTDSFEALANHALGPLIYEGIKAQTTPDAWFPMNEPQSSTSIGNLVPGGVSAPLVSSKFGSVPFQLGATSYFPGTSESVLSLANSTGATGTASQYQMVGPQNPSSGYSFPFGSKWGVGVFARMTGGASVVWSALDKDGSVMAYVLVDAKNQQVATVMRAGGPGGAQNSAVVTFGAGFLVTGVFIHAGYDGTNLFCHVYYVNSIGQLGYLPASTAVPNCTGTSTWVAWGQAFRSDGAIYASSNADMQLCHGVIWTTAPPAPVSNPIILIATAGLIAFAGYVSHDQTAYIVQYFTEFTGLAGDPKDGQPLGQMRDTNQTSALDALRQTTLDYLGRVYMNRFGSIAWNSVHHQMGAPTTWTLGGNTAAGEMPYSGAPAFDFDPTYVYNDVQVQRPDTRGVIQTGTSTKAVARVTDAASKAAYFQRVLQVDANVEADADALAVAQYLLSKYRQPKTRVRTLTFNPAANPALWPFVLKAELGDTVTLNHRSVSRATVSLTLSIQKISHDIDAVAGTWVTTMELAPWSSDWALAAMHTTIHGTFGAGVTSLQIAPLPDSATNSAEQSLGVGTKITLSKGTANEETLTIKSVTSLPTAGATGYTSIAVAFTAATAYPHNNGEVVCDPLPSGVTDPTSWDAFSVLDSTTVVSI